MTESRKITISILNDKKKSKSYETSFANYDWIITQISKETYIENNGWIKGFDEWEKVLWDTREKPLVYVLIGKDIVYVGETGSFWKNRWKNHLKKREWVEHLFFLHLRFKKNINSDDIRFLEKCLIKKVKEMNIKIENGNDGQIKVFSSKTTTLSRLIDDVVFPAIRMLETPLLYEKFLNKNNNTHNEIRKEKIKVNQNDIIPTKWTRKENVFYGKFSKSRECISIDAGQDINLRLDLQNKWHSRTAASVKKRLLKWEKEGIVNVSKWENNIIVYSFLKNSPWLRLSTAAVVLSGKNKSGWDCWRKLTGEKLEKKLP